MTERIEYQRLRPLVKAEVRRGPKEIPIDLDSVKFQMQSGCSGRFIARTLGIHPDTLYDRLRDVYGKSFTELAEEMKEDGKDLLRMAQLRKALDGNVVMLIWLGKQLLGQRDNNQEVVVSKENKENIERLLKALAPSIGVTPTDEKKE